MTLLLRNWRLIGLGILLLVIAALWWRLDTVADQRDDARAAMQLEIAKHAITRQSVETLTGKLNEVSAAVREMAAASDARRKAAQDALGKAVEREKANEAVIARLRSSAAQAGSACAVSDTLAGVEGL